MVNLLIRLLVSAGAVLLAQWLSLVLVQAEIVSRPLLVVDNVPAALVFAVILGVLNALVRPILLLLTCLINLLTLGLFVLVVNAAVFGLAASLTGGVQVGGFLGALFGSLVVSLCSWIASNFLE